MAVCLLSAVRKQQLKQYNYHVDQSELLTRFWTDFTSSLWNFCRWGADVSHGETSLAAKTEARRLFSRAKYCAVADPDLQIRGPWSSRPWDKGAGGGGSKKIFRPPGPQFGLNIGGGGGGGGGLKKKFSALRASVWSKHRGGGGGLPRPLPWIRHWLRTVFNLLRIRSRSGPLKNFCGTWKITSAKTKPTKQ